MANLAELLDLLTLIELSPLMGIRVVHASLCIRRMAKKKSRPYKTTENLTWGSGLAVPESQNACYDGLALEKPAHRRISDRILGNDKQVLRT